MNRILHGCIQLLEATGHDLHGMSTQAIKDCALTLCIEALYKNKQLHEPVQTVSPDEVREVLRLQPVPDAIIANLDSTLAELERADDKQSVEELKAAVHVGTIDRVSAQEPAPVITTPPWERSKMVAENEPALLADITYKHAPNDLFRYAVRAVYWNLDIKKWSTEESTTLVMQTYKVFVSWRDAQQLIDRQV